MTHNLTLTTVTCPQESQIVHHQVVHKDPVAPIPFYNLYIVTDSSNYNKINRKNINNYKTSVYIILLLILSYAYQL